MFPKGAFMYFLKFQSREYSEELAIELLKGGVLCSQSSAFGKSVKVT